MPIEFRCTQCNKLLRTPDDTAGKQAKCPECGAIVTVPAPEAAEPTGDIPFAPETPPPPPPPGGSGDSPFAQSPRTAFDPENPYASPGEYSTAGPLSGTAGGAFTPTAIEIGEVFSRTWEIFKDQWGMCLLVLIVVWVINFVFQMAVGLFTGMIGAMGNNDAMIVTASLLGNLATTLFSVWIGVGQALFFLKIARGQDAELGDIFTGGPYFITVLLASLLVFVIVFFGFLALIIPGIILALMFSQFYYLILDRDVGVMDSLSLSKEITTGNKMTLLAIGLLSLILVLVSLIPCGLGLLIAAPYFTLMYPVIYLSMTGQYARPELR